MQRYSKSKNKNVVWEKAPDISTRINEIIIKLDLNWIQKENFYTLRSYNAKARAYARIWGLPRVWQMVLKSPPKYIIEVISEKFDRESVSRQNEILIHELVHIPRNFSGALKPHTKKRKGSFKDILQTLLTQYKNNNL